MMHKINKLFCLSSLSVILVTIERFSFTTKILLQPYDFLRLHELFQMTVLILLTVIIPFLLLKEVTQNFETIKTKKGFWLILVFVVGIYFYATGNGLHEVSSFNLNNFCDTEMFTGKLCNSFFINDYYTGNILYFIGGTLMVVTLMLLEKLKPNTTYRKKDVLVSVVNAVIYAFAIFAYAAFDVVLVGMVYSAVLMFVSLYLFWTVRKDYLKYPVITYTMLTYTIGTIAALIVRFH
ncbi:MAG TPA: hypothetical protein VLI92_02600 [Candidatus Saccharimonadales bacterium]|nr:hypothetical protein [Candidatus Saccharimonadales bacterium]